MIVINNKKDILSISFTLLYGAGGATKMKLKSMQTNEEFEIALCDTSPDGRYGIFGFKADGDLPLNSGEVIDDVTYINVLSGKYIYTISLDNNNNDNATEEEELMGIFYAKEEKNNEIIIYEETDNTNTNTKVYNG